MVCYYHLSRGNPRFLPDSSLVKRAGSLGWPGVEIFFVISGFIIPYAMYNKNYSTSDFLVFLKKRILRIEPPYLVSILIVIALNFVSTLSPFYRGAPFSVDFANLAGHVAYLNVFTGGKWLNPVYWSLAIEFQYYLLIAFAFGLITSKNPLYRILFFVFFAASSFLSLQPNSFVFSYSGYFLAGILLFQLVCRIITPKEFWGFIVVALILLSYQQGIVLAALAAVTLLIITYVNEVPSFFRYMGLISYSLYLIHGPIGARIINIAEVKVHNVFLRECIVFLAFGISVLASGLFYKYVEKRFKKLSGSIKYDRHANAALKNALP
jgi:peptidoglycan/LPS O-acetylase OafA/YrhL